MHEGAAFLKMLVNGESDQERSIQLVANQNRVHIANLHKVKGLEAPVVILADPIKKTGEPALRVDYGGNDPQSYVFSIKLSEESYNTIDCIDYPDEFAKEIDVLGSENTRLLYVAATRAENLLIVANAMNSKGEPDENNPWLPLIAYIDKDILSVLGEYKPFQPAEKNLLDAAPAAEPLRPPPSCAAAARIPWWSKRCSKMIWAPRWNAIGSCSRRGCIASRSPLPLWRNRQIVPSLPRPLTSC